MPGPALSLTERNGTIAVGGTAQNAMPVNNSRRYLLIQNPFTAAGQGIATAENLYVRFEGTAGINNGTSFELAPGGSIEIASRIGPKEAVSVVAATTAHAYIAVEG